MRNAWQTLKKARRQEAIKEAWQPLLLRALLKGRAKRLLRDKAS
jgi:hypothetical protein